MFAWKTIAMAETTIEYAAGEEYGHGHGHGMDGYGLAWVSCNTTKFMHSPAGDCTNIERTLPRLSDTMQHLSNAQRQAQYTHTHPPQTHTHRAHNTPMQSAIRQRVSFYCLVDNCQELKLEERMRDRAEERERKKKERVKSCARALQHRKYSQNEFRQELSSRITNTLLHLKIKLIYPLQG